MRFCRIQSLIAAVLFAIGANGAVNVTASRDYVDRKVHTLTTNVEERVENISNRIETVKTNLEDRISSAQPGNYLVVSNNAMNALSRDEAIKGVTEWKYTIPDGFIITEPLNYSAGEWEFSLKNVDTGVSVNFHSASPEDSLYISMTSSGVTVTASRTKLPTMKDVEGLASTNDVRLSPVYDADRFSKWTILRSGVDVTSQVGQPTYWSGEWDVENSSLPGDGTTHGTGVHDINATTLTWGIYTATRTDTPAGYRLGSQTGSELASTGSVAKVKAAMSGKQDSLPYPTNAIPYAAVDGAPTKLSQFQNDSGFITSSTAPVKTVNSKSGNVTLDALDVGAIPQTGMVVNVTSGTMHFSPRLSVGVWPSGYKPINISGGSGAAFTFGDMVHTEGANTMALGTGVLNTNAWSFIWSGDANRYYAPGIPSMNNPYSTRYNGGFHVNPSVRTGMTNPLQNFWIGDTNLNDWIEFLAPAPDLSGYLPKSGGDMTGGLTVHGAGIKLTTPSGLLGGNYLEITKDGIEIGANGTPNPFTFSFPEESGTLSILSDLDTCIRTTTTNIMQVMEGALRIDGTDSYGMLYLSGKSLFGISGGMIYFSDGASGLVINPEGIRRMTTGNFKQGLISFPTDSGTVALTSQIPQTASDVSALPDSYDSLTNNVNFANAVAAVSPPADLSDYVAFVDAGATIPSTGICLALAESYAYVTNTEEVVVGNVTNIVTTVTTNSYPVVTLYKDGTKIWTSDPADESNIGWLIGLILALVGGAGTVLWRYFGKSKYTLKIDPDTGSIYYETED